MFSLVPGCFFLVQLGNINNDDYVGDVVDDGDKNDDEKDNNNDIANDKDNDLEKYNAIGNFNVGLL